MISQSRHLFRRLTLWRRQPGTDQSNTSVKNKGIWIFDIRIILWKSVRKLFQKSFCQKVFNLFYKCHITVWSKKRQAQITVFIHDGKELDNKWQYGIRVTWVNRVVLHNFRNILHCFFFNFMQHLINVCIVQIKGRTIDIDLIYQFFYGNFLDTFLLHESGKSFPELCFRFADTSVHFFCHVKIPQSFYQKQTGFM